MSKIESRPRNARPGVFFFVDIDGHASEKKVQDASKRFRSTGTFVKILGTYPKTLPT